MYALNARLHQHTLQQGVGATQMAKHLPVYSLMRRI
ncbi:hypothetical protein F442_22677 [Phytophthora nicotianae P10297]|uniref:Uncharacterized protein n=1 Tax=Phytophthora nicotianae P10297 TaxID=1317064 RepID=W2Y1H4_PHYNI|nr:hypothetical protein F442_22677 [Phytophthora nicotianae P10297]